MKGIDSISVACTFFLYACIFLQNFFLFLYSLFNPWFVAANLLAFLLKVRSFVL